MKDNKKEILDERSANFEVLHRIGSLYMSLLKKTLCKSSKYPKEAELVDRVLKEFLERKVEELYGFGTVSLPSEEPNISKEEAQQMIQQTLFNLRLAKAEEEKKIIAQEIPSSASPTEIPQPKNIEKGNREQIINPDKRPMKKSYKDPNDGSIISATKGAPLRRRDSATQDHINLVNSLASELIQSSKK